MSLFKSFPVQVSSEQQRELEQRMEELSRPSGEFFVLLSSATVIASLGLFQNSPGVIIGAMIIAPLMRPLMGLALSSISADSKLFSKAMLTLLLGTFLTICISYCLASLLESMQFTSEMLGRTKPNLLDLGIAFVAGAVGAYCQSNASIRDTLAGVAIAVALVPPLSVVGIGLAFGSAEVSGGAALLYITNLIGITVAASSVFLLRGYSAVHKAKAAIIWSLVFTSLLIIPLWVSMTELILENRLSGQITELLKERTQTFRKVDLQRVEVKRFKTPMDVVVSVYGDENDFTSKQIQYVQEFLIKNLSTDLRLAVRVIPYKEINAVQITPEKTQKFDPSKPSVQDGFVAEPNVNLPQDRPSGELPDTSTTALPLGAPSALESPSKEPPVSEKNAGTANGENSQSTPLGKSASQSKQSSLSEDDKESR